MVGLIRTLLLKRFESSAVSFQASCEDLLLKLSAFVEENQFSAEKIAKLKKILTKAEAAGEDKKTNN